MTVEFGNYPNDTVATEGDQVTSNCNVTGVPTPQIAWKKDGELVMNGTKITVTTSSPSSGGYTASQLQIRQVSKQDVAVYSCIAWNRGSIRVWQATVLLTGKFRFIYFVSDSLSSEYILAVVFSTLYNYISQTPLYETSSVHIIHIISMITSGRFAALLHNSHIRIE